MLQNFNIISTKNMNFFTLILRLKNHNKISKVNQMINIVLLRLEVRNYSLLKFINNLS